MSESVGEGSNSLLLFCPTIVIKCVLSDKAHASDDIQQVYIPFYSSFLLAWIAVVYSVHGGKVCIYVSPVIWI